MAHKVDGGKEHVAAANRANATAQHQLGAYATHLPPKDERTNAGRHGEHAENCAHFRFAQTNVLCNQ